MHESGAIDRYLDAEMALRKVFFWGPEVRPFQSSKGGEDNVILTVATCATFVMKPLLGRHVRPIFMSMRYILQGKAEDPESTWLKKCEFNWEVCPRTWRLENCKFADSSPKNSNYVPRSFHINFWWLSQTTWRLDPKTWTINHNLLDWSCRCFKTRDPQNPTEMLSFSRKLLEGNIFHCIDGLLKFWNNSIWSPVTMPSARCAPDAAQRVSSWNSNFRWARGA